MKRNETRSLQAVNAVVARQSIALHRVRRSETAIAAMLV